jgi:hypothetical protein
MAEENKGGRPALFETDDDLSLKINEYFLELTVNKEPATITGLALYLGFESRQSFYDYEDRDGFSYTIKRARLRIEHEYEKKLTGNNVAGPIFALKNLSWKDKTEQDLNVSGGISWHEERTYEKPGPDEIKSL